MMYPFETQNRLLFLQINADQQTPAWLIQCAAALANDLIYVVPVLMIALWLLGGQMRRKQVLHMFLMTLLALGLNQLAALAWPHPRPFMVALGHTFIAHADDSSFPSDHMTVFACVGLRLLLDRAYRLAAGVLAAGSAVAWARVFLGVHFPFDMIGALMIAAVACLLMWSLWRRVGDTVTALSEQLYRRVFSWPIAAGMLRH